MRSEDVQGRWKSILPCFGISGRFLVNKHGPCPMCGGRDRFRFDDIEGNGTWICNQCGAGNGFTMLKLLYGWEFQEALKKIGEAVVLGVNGDQEQPKPAEVVDDDARHEAHMRVLRGCRKITTADPAGQYLEGRGIPAQLSDALLYHPALYNHDERMDVPAMIAPIMSIDGKLLSLHRTFLLPNGVSRKIMPPVGTITGGAVHLFEPGEVLGVAEGIETALCAHLRFGTPTWACISAHGLESVEIPEGVSHVVIYGDNDGSYTGQKAAYVLAHRLVTRDHLDVLVVIPKQIGLDWADMPELIEGKEARKEIALSYLNRANLWLQKKVPKEQWNDGIERSVKESRQVAKVCREYIDGKVPVANLKAAIKKWARKFRWGEA